MILRLQVPLLVLTLTLTSQGLLKAQGANPVYGIGVISNSDSPPVNGRVPLGETVLQDHLIILEVTPSSPAEKCGLEQGDEIIQIDDRNVGGMKFADAANLLRGPKGSSVKVTVIRQGEANALFFTIPRAPLDFPARR
jgi:carboxyl-terminal processing protease